MSTNAPSSAPGTTPPESVADTLRGLREDVGQANDLHNVPDTLVDRTIAALEDARKQAMTIGETARDGLRAELAQWNLDRVPEVLKGAVEATKKSVEDIYSDWQSKTVSFNKPTSEKFFESLSGLGEKVTTFMDAIQKTIARIVEKLQIVPLMMQFGVTVPDWLLPNGMGMKELFAVLSANKRTLETGPKDEENMREVIKVLSGLNTGKLPANQLSLDEFLKSVVEQGPSEKKALTTEDILNGARAVAQNMKQQPAATSAPAAPAAAPAAPTAAPAASAAPAPAGTAPAGPTSAPAAAPSTAPAAPSPTTSTAA